MDEIDEKSQALDEAKHTLFKYIEVVSSTIQTLQLLEHDLRNLAQKLQLAAYKETPHVGDST